MVCLLNVELIGKEPLFSHNDLDYFLNQITEGYDDMQTKFPVAFELSLVE